MLNGKFFTGLPPKMIDRGGARQNRLESHFFWPDDTEVDTAVDRRIKRRNSVQLASNERPLYEKQMSVGVNDVDTKKRFSKEFSQSSIQFYDNLNEDRSNSRRSMLRNAMGTRKMQITEKPTNTKLKLPESVVDEAYTTAKKKQAYTSTIEFYDFVNEEEKAPQNNRNNLRKPKMDMNDKREMELNSKNSPKLQVKRDVRSLSKEKELRKINNREVMERSKVTKTLNDTYNKREKERILGNEERYLQSRRSVEPRINSSPKRGSVKNERFSCEKEIYREPASSTYDRRRRDSSEKQQNQNQRFSQREYDEIEDDLPYRRVREEPKRVIRNNTRANYEPEDERSSIPEYQGEEEIRSRMRKVHLNSPPQMHYYPPEEYYNDEPESYYRHNEEIKAPTNRGSTLHHVVYNDSENVELIYDDVNSLKNGSTRSSPPPSHQESQNAQKSHKHLRSSLCFNDGAIIAENEATRSPTSHYPTQRRNARSSATQRVSVGLPD